MSYTSPQPTHQINVGVIKELQNQTEKHTDAIDTMKLLMWAVILVLFVGFAGALITVGGYIMQYEANKQATYLDLANKVSEQNTKNEAILQELKDLHSEQFTCQYIAGGINCHK